jgi:hypothetical protein
MNYRHSYRKSVLEKERHYELQKEGIHITSENRNDDIPYSSIHAIHLKFDPSRFAPDKYLCQIYYDRDVEWISNSHYVSIGEFESRSESYCRLIEALHRPLASNPKIVFKQGISSGKYYFFIAIVVFMLISVGWAMISWFDGSGSLIWARLGLLLVMAWMSIRYFKNNRPGYYDPMHIPDRLLPKG